jgi:predicted permease
MILIARSLSRIVESFLLFFLPSMTDIRYALRTLLRNPGFSLIAVLTLGLGIGANTAIFSLVNAVLLRPLPYRDSNRLVQVWTVAAADAQGGHSAGDYLDLYRENQSLSALAGYRSNLYSVAARTGEPHQLVGAHVTAEFFEALGVGARVGRTFTRADGGTGETVVVLNDTAWRDLFGSSDPGPGRPVRLNGGSAVVIGVLAAGAEWPRNTRLWVLSDKPVPPSPIELQDGVDPLTDRDVRYFDAIARLKPEVTIEQAQQDLNRVGSVIRQRQARTSPRRDLRLGLLRDRIVGDVRFALAVLQGAVGVVLLIACANVSSLLLARATARKRELTIRAALGASRTRLVRQLLTESLVLGAVGGGAGLLLGVWLTALLQGVLPDSVPRAENVSLDRVVALTTTLMALGTGMLFGIVPALQASRAQSSEALKGTGERGNAGRARVRAGLVVAEVALTLVLLTGAGLLLNSLLRLQGVDSGLEPDNVTLVSLVLPESRYPTAASQVELYRRLLEGVAQRGNVQVSGIGFPGPLRGSSASGSFFIEGRSDAPEDRPFANLASVSAGYFAAMGIPLVEGRTVTDADTADSPEVAVVTRTLARRYWPGESALGKRLRFDNDSGTPWRTVVGVVRDVKQLGLDVEAPPVMFIPYSQFALPFTTLAVRSGLSSASIAALVRTQLAALDEDLAPGDIKTLQDVLHGSMAQPRFRTFLISSFALVALVLAAVGVYGLISSSVTQRTREIGIRLALGATPRLLLGALMREGLVLCALGIGIGVVGALLTARVLATFLFGISPGDPLTFASVAMLLVAVGALATYIPARRTLSVDPMVALRVE